MPRGRQNEAPSMAARQPGQAGRSEPDPEGSRLNAWAGTPATCEDYLAAGAAGGDGSVRLPPEALAMWTTARRISKSEAAPPP